MKRGQGLLETIIAIGVITTGLVSVISLVVSNLTSARDSALRYQALNFAREGIELVRNMRDSNWLLPSAPGSFDGISGQGAQLTFEFTPGSSDPVRLDPDMGEAQNLARQIQSCRNGASGQGSIFCTGSAFFSRTITVTEQSCAVVFPENQALCDAIESSDPIALDVTSEVTWPDRGGTHRVQLTARLYDWR